MYERQPELLVHTYEMLVHCCPGWKVYCEATMVKEELANRTSYELVDSIVELRDRVDEVGQRLVCLGERWLYGGIFRLDDGCHDGG